METISEVTETRQVRGYVAECDICKKKITGTSEGQVRFNLMVHKQSKECGK